MKHVGCLLGALALSTAVTACDGRPREVTTQERKLLVSSNDFGFQLFDKVVQDAGDDNVFISPLSVSVALGMTLNGAAGDTETGMQTALGLTGLTRDEINEGYRGLLELLDDLDPGVQMEIANSIWYRDSFSVAPDFIEDNETYFDAAVEALDFATPAAGDTINDWVDDKTHGKIHSIVDGPISDQLMMLLVNAVYFKGTWANQFKKTNTRDDQFATSSGAEKPVKLMNQSETLPYHENEDLQAVRLPYGDSYFAMSILLPKEGKEVDDVVSTMTSTSWNGLMDAMVDSKVQLSMPRFELSTGRNLNDVLAALGMEAALNPDRADFTRMNPDGGLYISEVKQKTFVRVDEEGTEAAAATSVGMSTTSIPRTIEMRVDRPFVFVIHDTYSGAMLFTGKIVDPDSK